MVRYLRHYSLQRQPIPLPEHTMDPLQPVRDDLRYVFGFFTIDCLLNLRLHPDRLIRRRFSDGSGGGCIMHLLSEPLPAEQRIVDPPSLTRYFTGASGYPACEEPQYQPARHLVRLWDGMPSSRYPGVHRLSRELVISVLDQVLEERSIREREEAALAARVARCRITRS